jgi:hypothetical protein
LPNSIDDVLGLLSSPFSEALHARAEGTLSIRLRGSDKQTVFLQVAHEVGSSPVAIEASRNRTLEGVVGSIPGELSRDTIYEHIGRDGMEL